MSHKHRIESAPSRPEIGVIDFDSIPEFLRDLCQWVNWRYSRRPGEPRWTKVPQKHLPSKKGGPLSFAFAKSSDPKTWGTFDAAASAVIRSGNRPGPWRRMYGLGCMLAEGGNVTAFDFDDCRNPATGNITPEVMVMIRRLNSYTEISPSGTGLKVYIFGTKTCNKSKHRGRQIEVYDRLRFLAVTGDHLAGTPTEIEDRQDVLDSILRELFPNEYTPEAAGRLEKCRGGNEPIEPAPLDDSLREIVQRIHDSKQGAKFGRLMRGDISDYDNDRSDADIGLAAILAWWLRGDESKIAAVMWSSALVRKKWERADYLPPTIREAISRCKSFYGDRQDAPLDADLAAASAADQAASTKADASVAAYDPACDHRAHVDCCAAHIRGRLLADWREGTEKTRDAMRAMRRDHERFPCCCPRAIVFRVKETRDPVVTTIRCEKPDCEGCRGYLIQRELDSLRHHWTAAGQLYEFGCTKENWQRMQKRIRRAKGQYAKLEDGDGFWVVTDCPVEDAVAVPTDAALSSLETYLNDWDDHRPLTTSRGWKLLSLREDEKVYERIGNGLPGLTAEKIAEVAKKHGAEVVVSAADPSTPSRVMRKATLRRCDWTDDGSMAAALELTCREFDPAGFCWRTMMAGRRGGSLAEELGMLGT